MKSWVTGGGTYVSLDLCLECAVNATHMTTSFLGILAISSIMLVSSACAWGKASPSCVDGTFSTPSIGVADVEDDSLRLSEEAMLGQASRDPSLFKMVRGRSQGDTVSFPVASLRQILRDFGVNRLRRYWYLSSSSKAGEVRNMILPFS